MCVCVCVCVCVFLLSQTMYMYTYTCRFHSVYGLGYKWVPETLTVQLGGTVEWFWTGSAFTSTRNVAQVEYMYETCTVEPLLKDTSERTPF